MLLSCHRLRRVREFSFNQRLRERDLLWLSGLRGAARQQQGETSCPERRHLVALLVPELSVCFCLQHQAITSNGFHNNHIMESSQCQITALDSHSMFRKVGAGQGGEGAEDRKGPGRRGRDAGRDASHHNWREREWKCSWWCLSLWGVFVLFSNEELCDEWCHQTCEHSL